MKFTFTPFLSLFTILIIAGCSKKDSFPPKASTYGLTTTFAGSGYPASVDSTGLAAAFNEPAAIVIDAAGNLYVADSGNNEIRKITPSGTVITIAGSVNKGSTNGIGIAASFANPLGIAIDVSGNLYVADSGNNLIRKMTSAGVVTTLAGSGAVGALNGPGATATFNNPCGVTVDLAGNVYVADAGNNLIRIITPTGMVSTLAGNAFAGATNGSGATASFNNPQGLTIDATGNLYVADGGNHLIREINPSGAVTTFAGSGNTGYTNGTLLTASFNEPDAVAFDAGGNMYIADEGANMIRKVTSNGTISTIAGNGAIGFVNGTGNTITFNEPAGVVADNSGNLYVCDYGNSVIRKIVVKQ
ncbi:NHL repeat-containing protein [Mucilaginibacter sp. X4EP1]|uniref:NHL repeat-containing protein n=1 Tax=Mucilaginibacter sp. X4EP1 TaxID=2723092 RepID=UPI0021696075|nr:NHL repeat-containing protein [Mucilaginibacter sp. X4EP1]MCS3815757.1 sugar lactone lactonase YvrE [Mucilaginibacter sp. X4EP1]